MFREDKATALAYWLIKKAGGGSMPHKKLMKLLYLYEREQLRSKGLTLIGDRFVNMDEGPVLSETYNCMKPPKDGHPLTETGTVWRQFLSPINNFQISRRADLPVESVLTKKQMKQAEELWDTYGKMSEKDLILFTHGLPEWHDPKGSSEVLDLLPVFLDFGYERDDALERIDRLRDLARHQAFFGSVV